MSVPRHVELWLSDFETDPTVVVAPHPELRIHPYARGTVMRSGRLRQTNWLIVERSFGYLTSWDLALEGLVAAIGGETELARLLERVGAKRQYVGFDLPIDGSPNQEGNGLSLASLDLLCRLKLELQFGFWPFDESDPTHRDPNGRED